MKLYRNLLLMALILIVILYTINFGIGVFFVMLTNPLFVVTLLLFTLIHLSSKKMFPVTKNLSLSNVLTLIGNQQYTTNTYYLFSGILLSLAVELYFDGLEGIFTWWSLLVIVWITLLLLYSYQNSIDN